MLKQNKSFFRLFLTVIGVVFFILTGCKSTPLAVEVDPLDILDSNSSFYLSIPSDVDPELIVRIIKNNVDGISDGDAKLLASKINKVYCGMNRSKNRTTIQAAIDTSIPQKYVPKVLNKKNGFNSKAFTPKGSLTEYQIYNNGVLDVACPSSKILCLGRDVETLVSNYDYIFTTAEPGYEPASYSELESELYTYLKDAETEIRFYANKPQSFLTILTGANLDLKLTDVSGSFSVDAKHDNQYLLDLTFNFKNEKYLKAGKVLLTLAFGLTDSQSQIDGATLRIQGIKIKKEQLYKLIVL